MIRIVTDSVASIPADMLKGTPVEVITLFVNHDGKEHADAEMDLDEFYKDIYDMIDDIPTSSQPSQLDVEEVFERAAQAGEEVLGIFISSGLSGTFEGMVRAAQAVRARNTDFTYVLIDSSSCGFDEAWPVFAAVEAVSAGASLDECLAAVEKSIRSTRFVFTPESLKFLQKGGRIGNAAAMLGAIARITPVLTVRDGKATTLGKTRSRKKALELIIKTFREDIEGRGLKNIVVHYIGEKAPALEWARNVIEPLVGFSVRVLPVSPVIGLHVGPAIGIAYECKSEIKNKINCRIQTCFCA